jgi:hypothetical protein
MLMRNKSSLRLENAPLEQLHAHDRLLVLLKSRGQGRRGDGAALMPLFMHQRTNFRRRTEGQDFGGQGLGGRQVNRIRASTEAANAPSEFSSPKTMREPSL